MTGPTTLLDIGDLTEEVKIGEVTIHMRGLSAGDIFGFLVRFPALRLIFDKTTDKEKQKYSEADIMQLAPRAVYEAVAMCDINLPHDANGVIPPKVLKKAATAVERLPISHQQKLVAKFFDLTFTDGLGPFVEEFQTLMKKFDSLKKGAEEVAEASVGNSHGPSGDASFTVDTPFERRGVPHLVN